MSEPGLKVAAACPACGEFVHATDRYCEACGAKLPPPVTLGLPTSLPVGDPGPLPGRGFASASGQECGRCGRGTVSDGYCDQCGLPPEVENAHVITDLAPWLGGCSDIGRRHENNEDALELACTGAAGEVGVLVVCDGVTSAPLSARAAGAAAAAAATALIGDPTQVVEAAHSAAVAAAEVGVALGEVASPPSCTLAVGVLTPLGASARIATANVGDSRAYWLPDEPTVAARRLSRDDSLAAERIAAGMSVQEAESGQGAHAITAWLGKDAPPVQPHLAEIVVSEPGWLLVCSDGLWNYHSEPDDLRRQTWTVLEELGQATMPARLADTSSGPARARAVHVAQALVGVANAAGGRDNITVALARWEPTSG